MKEVLLFVEPKRELREPFSKRLRELGYTVIEDESLDSGSALSAVSEEISAVILGIGVPHRLNFIKASTRFRRETPVIVMADLSVDEVLSEEFQVNDVDHTGDGSEQTDEIQLLLRSGASGPLFPMSGDIRIKQVISEAIRKSAPQTDHAVNLPWVIEGVAGRLEKIGEAIKGGESLSPVEEIAKRAVLMALEGSERGEAAVSAEDAALVLRGKRGEV